MQEFASHDLFVKYYVLAKRIETLIILCVFKKFYLSACLKTSINPNLLRHWVKFGKELNGRYNKFYNSAERQALGSDDLIIFKCFRVNFFLKKSYPNSAFVQSLFSTKKSLTLKSLFDFWRHKQDKWLFQFSGSYVSF